MDMGMDMGKPLSYYPLGRDLPVPISSPWPVASDPRGVGRSAGPVSNSKQSFIDVLGVLFWKPFIFWGPCCHEHRALIPPAHWATGGLGVAVNPLPSDSFPIPSNTYTTTP